MAYPKDVHSLSVFQFCTESLNWWFIVKTFCIRALFKDLVVYYCLLIKQSILRRFHIFILIGRMIYGLRLYHDLVGAFHQSLAHILISIISINGSCQIDRLCRYFLLSWWFKAGAAIFWEFFVIFIWNRYFQYIFKRSWLMLGLVYLFKASFKLLVLLMNLVNFLLQIGHLLSKLFV